MEKKRIFYFDILRAIGCVLVVGVHVSAFSMDELPLRSMDFFFANAYDCLSIFGVPLFVMLSGALELNRDFSDSTQEILHSVKKSCYLILLYFLWLAFYNVLNCVQEGYGFSLNSVKQNILLSSLLGRGIYHLWFLPMLAGLTLVSPFLRLIARNKKISCYFLVLYAILTILFPTLLKFQYRFPYYELVEGLYSRIPYVVITGFTGYFLLGHFLAFHLPSQSKNKNILFLCVFLFSWGIGAGICFYDSLLWGQPSTIINDPYSVTDFLAVTSLFLLVKNIFSKTDEAKTLWPCFIRTLADCSLGIYLLHPALLMLLKWTGFSTLFLPQVLSIPLTVVGVVVICLLITFLLRKIPGIGKLLS